MAVIAGYAVRAVGITTSSTTMTLPTDLVAGVRNFSFPRGREMLETTNFKDNSDATRGFIAGLKNVEVSFDCDYNPSGDTPTGRVETALGDGSSVWAQLAYNSTPNGWKVECKVESVDLKGEVAGKLEASVKLRATGAVATF